MNSKLTIVLEKAQRDKDNLAERLQKAQAFLAAERQQLVQLKDYERDYEQKINDQSQQQSIDSIRRYRSFYHQLGQLMGEQERKMIIAEQQIDQLRQALIQQQQKINVLQKLAKEHFQQEQFMEERQLQKTIDDLSAQAAFKRSL